MSRLFLIRHGQASFGAENYDVLSDLGEQQARRLGEYWGQIGMQFDTLFSGPCKRQLDTAQGLISGANSKGGTFPQATMLEDWNEYPAFELFKHWIPRLTKKEPTIADDMASGDARRIEKIYLRITRGWARGEMNAPKLQSYKEFSAAVRRGLIKVMETAQPGSSIGVVTSAGPIALVMGFALGLPPESLTMGWTIRNSSVNEFRFRITSASDTAQFALFGFNHVPHLTQEDLITYR